MSNCLYEEMSHYYDLISNDRDFVSECDYFLDFLPQTVKEVNVLELFAGPAYHSSKFKEKGCFISCIDSSKFMKDIALKRHNISPKEYKVGKIPDLLVKFPKVNFYN